MTSAATGRARRGPVLAATGVGGTALLSLSLSTKPGSPRFYILTMGLAGTWAAGAISSGPLPLRRPGRRHNGLLVAGSVLTGAAAFGLFYGAARLARHIPPLNRAIGTVLGYADRGSMPLVLLTASANAVAEELFFHGALWPAKQQPHPIATTTLAYAATTAATRNPALVLAGIATSVLFGIQRHTSGGVLAPALSHITWSLLMLIYLPPLYRTPPAGRAHPRLTGRGRVRLVNQADRNQGEDYPGVPWAAAVRRVGTVGSRRVSSLQFQDRGGRPRGSARRRAAP